MDRKMNECIKMLKNLVSTVQGAPYPGPDLKVELYTIWFEHAQRIAVECYEYMNNNFPKEKNETDKALGKILGSEH